jgi:two-component system, sensor histidine kinase PdtaS
MRSRSQKAEGTRGDSFQFGYKNAAERAGTTIESLPFNQMNKLYPLVLEHHLPLLVRYCIAASIMLVCAVLQIALQSVTRYPGYFLLLPGVFVSGLMFDRGSGILAAIIGIGVGAYGSYAAPVGSDFVSVNGLFAITAAGTAVVAESCAPR